MLTDREGMRVTARNSGSGKAALEARRLACKRSAYEIRMGVLEEGQAQGEGYAGQALGLADVLAVIYTDQLRYRPAEPDWPGRDRFLLSTGHYALLLYGALADAGVITREELTTYAADGSRLPMSSMATYTPGVEVSGGSLGHGLGLAVGMSLGLRHQGRTNQKVFVLFSDGELNEGSTWEAAMSAAAWQLGNLVALVDMNGLQADGQTSDVMRLGSQEARWNAFGWHVQRVSGNDVGALISAFGQADAVGSARGKPHIIICDTRLGEGVPMLQDKEKLHFMQITEDEWPLCMEQLTALYRRELSGGVDE